MQAARVEPMPGVREAVVAVDGTLVTPIQPASQLDARSTYIYPQAVEEVSMPGSNQADADAVFDAAATKVQAVLRGSSARKKSATKKAESGEVCWRTDGAWGGGMGWAVRVEAARMEPMPESAAAQGSVTAAGVREAVVVVVAPWHIGHA